ncbi:MAG: DUF4238 domain-containing protein [Lachnospiraceae bacterium]|nr:DUF4238 domain-containing protein [Lachnospiraceae bacterium]
MEKTKNQHYVPQMYIKRFGYGTERKPRISVLKKHEQEIMHEQNPYNFAAERYFYDTTEVVIENVLKEDLEMFPFIKESKSFKDAQLTEHTLSRSEGEYRKLLDQIEKCPFSIYEDKYRVGFICFMHELAYRTRSFRDGMDNINYRTEKLLDEMCDNGGLSEEFKRKTIEKNCTPGKNTQLEQVLSVKPALKTMEQVLMNYDWYIGYNNTELDFIISDNPAQMVRQGFNDVCIPISKNLAIVMRVKEKGVPMLSCDESEGKIINMSTKGVIQYNAMQIAMAQLYLFGSKAAISIMNDLFIHSKSLIC